MIRIGLLLIVTLNRILAKGTMRDKAASVEV